MTHTKDYQNQLNQLGLTLVSRAAPATGAVAAPPAPHHHHHPHPHPASVVGGARLVQRRS